MCRVSIPSSRRPSGTESPGLSSEGLTAAGTQTPGPHAEAELAEVGLLAARQHGGVAAATRLGMKCQLMYALLASARVAAAAGGLGRAHDDAYQALITGLGIRLCSCRRNPGHGTA